MNPPGLMAASAATAVSDASLVLRTAQRAFAPLLERNASFTPFRFAQLRSAARRALSALSADDRDRLTRWLAWLCVTDTTLGREAPEARLTRIDIPLAAGVAVELAPLREELIAQASGAAAA
jgi:hypothetical protein